MKKIKLAIAGLGTVGGGLLELLHTNKEVIAKHTHCEFEVVAVSVKDTSKKREYLPNTAKMYTDAIQLAGIEDVDIIIELVGGIDLPKQLIKKALENGKSVITANKALLAEEGTELFNLAANNNLHLQFEAAVAGGIPIVHTLKDSLNGNIMQSVLGILNGTSNYILSEMTSEKLDFSQALKQAQELGFAEAEPSLDIDGFDAAHKLNLLIRLAWGVEYPYKNLLIEGIRDTNSMDIEIAREFGYKVKHLGKASFVDNKIEAGLFPALVSENALLAKVDGAYNAVKLRGNAVGPLFLHGQGAGALPTASAVLSDIITIAKGNDASNFGYASKELPRAQIISAEESVYPYYIRFMVSDAVGVLRDISGVFADNEVSIAQVIQKQRAENGYLPLVFITHKAPYKSILNAIPEIEKLNFTSEKPVCYRIFNV